jgi:Uri superfamily endonuclease
MQIHDGAPLNVAGGPSESQLNIRRFGSSDYHRSRSSHLFFSKERHSFQWLWPEVAEHFEGVEAELHFPE